MCGRYGFREGQAALRETLRLTQPPPQLPPRYNLAPTQTAPVAGQDEQGRRLGELRWGISIKRAGRASATIFNIRADTVLRNGLWRSRLLKARLVAPASHFYEWVREPGGKAKTPLLIRRKDGRPLCIAAVFGHSDHEPEARAFTLITTQAPPDLAHIHSRWPVVLDEESLDTWFDPATSPDALEELLMPPPADWFEYFPVGPGVNDVRNDSAGLAAPLGGQSRYFSRGTLPIR